MNSRNKPIIKRLFFILALAMSMQAAANGAASTYTALPAVDCVINPYRVVDISSPVAGIIENIYVERSQQVTAGQVVAQLEASVERANVALASYRAGVQSEIGLGQVNINFDKLRKKRVDSLLEKQNISVENADQIEREVQLSKWKLKQAVELENIRKLELRRAQAQLRQKSIGAPFDGFVLDTFKYRGEYVEDQAILRLAQLDPLVIEAIVPMENFGMVEAGMLAEVLPEVLYKGKMMGTVIAVDRIGDTASNTFGVRLSMPNPGNRIPAGLKCIVKFLDFTAEQLADKADKAAAGKTHGGLLMMQDGSTVEPVSLAKKFTVAKADPLELITAIDIGRVDETTPKIMQEVVFRQRDKTTQRAAAVKPADANAKPSSKPKTPTSYMVLMEQAKTDRETRELINRLRQAGVKDLLELDYGDNKGLISLGVYNSRKFAVNRQRSLEELGFASYTVERYQ